MTLPPTTLRIGMPSGSLQNATVELFAKAGYRVTIDSRSVFPRFDDPHISAVLFRAQEISRYVVDAIVDCTETGSSLKANNLRIVDTLLKSTTRFVASKAAWADPAKREKMENIA